MPILVAVGDACDTTAPPKGLQQLRGVHFHVDIAGHPDQHHVRTALEDLREVCGFFKILGTYPVDVH
jgi:prephenate dehydratase